MPSTCHITALRATGDLKVYGPIPFFYRWSRQAQMRWNDLSKDSEGQAKPKLDLISQLRISTLHSTILPKTGVQYLVFTSQLNIPCSLHCDPTFFHPFKCCSTAVILNINLIANYIKKKKSRDLEYYMISYPNITHKILSINIFTSLFSHKACHMYAYFLPVGASFLYLQSLHFI